MVRNPLGPYRFLTRSTVLNSNENALTRRITPREGKNPEPQPFAIPPWEVERNSTSQANPVSTITSTYNSSTIPSDISLRSNSTKGSSAVPTSTFLLRSRAMSDPLAWEIPPRTTVDEDLGWHSTMTSSRYYPSFNKDEVRRGSWFGYNAHA